MNFIKRIFKFIINSLPAPVRNYIVQIAAIAPNELLQDKVAFITGGTSGIGLSIAQAFLKSGAYVVITGRSNERIQKAIMDLNCEDNYTGRILGVEMNNANVETFEEKLNYTLEQLKGIGRDRIDILVNNAGVSGSGCSNAVESYESVLDTNLKGVYFLSLLFGRYFKDNKIEGNILNIASSSSLRPATSAYAVSKWGIRGLTLGFAKSLAPYGVTVNGIAPGPTATPMLMREGDKNISLANSPIGRYILPEEIANMAVIMVSPMGRTIVGDIVYMTGGAGVVTYDDIDYSF
ncbi:MAG: SDR family oxidoreductase [Rikenellaceae bacterium]